MKKRFLFALSIGLMFASCSQERSECRYAEKWVKDMKAWRLSGYSLEVITAQAESETQEDKDLAKELGEKMKGFKSEEEVFKFFEGCPSYENYLLEAEFLKKKDEDFKKEMDELDKENEEFEKDLDKWLEENE